MCIGVYMYVADVLVAFITMTNMLKVQENCVVLPNGDSPVF